MATTKTRKQSATRLSRRSADKQTDAPAGPTLDELFAADEADEAACTPPLDSEAQQFQKVREEDNAISRLVELADASAEEAAKIIAGAVAVLITPDDRKALQESCATSGGGNHYQKERSAILRILVQARSKDASAASIGEHWLAIRNRFLQTPDRLRSALERLVDYFPRPARKEWDKKHPAPPPTELKLAAKANKELATAGNSAAVDRNERIILRILKDSAPAVLTQEEIEGQAGNNRTPLSVRTIGDCLKRLRLLGYTHRPCGKHRGETLTESGVVAVGKLPADSLPEDCR